LSEITSNFHTINMFRITVSYNSISYRICRYVYDLYLQQTSHA